MARIKGQRRYQRQATRQSRAEYLPQKNSVRRSQHAAVSALRSEEDPLNAGLERAAASTRHNSYLSAADKAQLLASFASQQAQVPAGIASQVQGVREQGAEQLGDLREEQSAQRGSILSSLLTAAQTRQEETQSAIAAEGRQQATDLQTAELEKSLGLGTYAPAPPPAHTATEKALEEAELGKVNAEAAKTEHEATGNGLTPYQTLERGEAHHEDHATAAYWAKTFLEKGKAGEFPGVAPDPKEWSPETWNHLVGAVAKEGKVPVPAAERAVQAVQDHFEPAAADPFGVVGHAAGTAAAALQQSAPSSAGPPALLKLLAPTGRF